MLPLYDYATSIIPIDNILPQTPRRELILKGIFLGGFIYRIVGKFGGGKVWWINRSANRLLIVSINLYGLSLANHGQFAKPSRTKLSHCTVT